LQEGSAVKYLGIDIGHIEDIELLRQVYPNLKGESGGNRFIYVKIAITSQKFVNQKFLDSLPRQITKGLRAQIQPQGLTGSAYLSLIFLPAETNPPVQLAINIEHRYPYIPSATSTFAKLTDALNDIVSGIQHDNIPQLLNNINQLTINASTAIQEADVPGITQNTRKTLLTVDDTAQEYKLVAEQLLAILKKKQVNDSIDNIADITKSLQQTTLLANKTLIGLNSAVENTNQILMQFKVNEQNLLNHAEETASNLNIITNNAKDHPSQLLFSQPPPRLDPGAL